MRREKKALGFFAKIKIKKKFLKIKKITIYIYT